MFVEQARPILQLEPKSFVLEMVANAVHVHHGREIKELLRRLRGMYVVKQKVIKTTEHGDGANRTRIFFVGLHRRLGAGAHMFRFRKGTCMFPPTAISYAVQSNCRYTTRGSRGVWILSLNCGTGYPNKTLV